MAKEKFVFEALPKISNTEAPKETTIIPPKYPTEPEITKVTFFIDETLKEKTNDYGYWEGLTQQDVIILALEEFLKDKTPKPRPQSVKDRKVGRKKKA